VNLAVTLTAATIVLVALALALALAMTLVARLFRSRARPPAAARRIEPEESQVPAATRGSEGGDFYAPAFIMDPGHCFRLCRDPATGTAHACPGPVEGSGEFADHRGNLVEVEACSVHMIDLGNWRFKTVRG
jgi:hypothetical protein